MKISATESPFSPLFNGVMILIVAGCDAEMTGHGTTTTCPIIAA
jgi:hypothetical protein